MATVQEFADLLETEQRAVTAARYPNIVQDTDAYRAKVTPGRVYTKVDFGGSGKYMVENATGIIFGIKGYGQVHRGYRYGTLDTIHDWFWGEYTGTKKKVVARVESYPTVEETPTGPGYGSWSEGDRMGYDG